MLKKKKAKTEKDTSERWLLTYSDLMNLLLILFIILYSASRMDAAQFQQIAESLRVGFSTLSVSQSGSSNQSSSAPSDNAQFDGGQGVFNDAEIVQKLDNSASSGASASDEAEYQDFYQQLMQLLKENNLLSSVTVTSREEGVAITFADNVLFAKSSAVLNDSAYAIIDKIGALMTKLPFSYVLVEGHADSDKIHNQYYEDNMDLSAKRAANVWRRLVACGLPPEKMASVGYGEYRPVAPNDTLENKAKNRRVVISILKEATSTDDSASQASTNANSSMVIPDTGK